jgi:hypothetical protein
MNFYHVEEISKEHDQILLHRISHVGDVFGLDMKDGCWQTPVAKVLN